MSITITLSHEIVIFESLRNEWIELQNRSSASGASLAWQWIYVWYKHSDNFEELWLLTAREDNRLIGIAPLVKVKMQPELGFAWHQIRFIGAFEIHEHLDFIIEPGYEEQVIPLFIDKLFEHRERWDAISLSGLCETKTIEILQQSEHDWVENSREKRTEPYIILPDTVDEWMQSLNSKRRWSIRRDRRKLDEQFPDRWSITQVTQPDEVDETFDHLVRLHQAHWKSQGYMGNFRDGELTECYRELIHLLLENDSLRLYRLDIEGEPCAIDFCSHYRGRAHGYLTGVKRDVTNIALGMVLKVHCFEQAIGEGIPEYTLMWGEMAWKYSFGAMKREHQVFEIICNPRVRLQIKTVDEWRKNKARLSKVKSFLRNMASDTPKDEVDESE